MNYITGTKIIAVSRPDKRLNAFIQGGVINSFSLPAEITSIAPHAFDNISGLTEIVFNNQEDVVDVSENAGIGASVKFVVPEQLLDEYEAEYPERDIVSYETGYEWVIPYVEGETSTTLTAAYVNQCLMANPEAKKAKKVVVPEYFGNFEDGYLSPIIGSSIDTLAIYGFSSANKSQMLDKQLGQSNTQITKLYDYRSSLPTHFDGQNGTSGPYGGAQSGSNGTLEYAEMVNALTLPNNVFFNSLNLNSTKVFKANKATNVGNNLLALASTGAEKVELFSANAIGNAAMANPWSSSSINVKVWLGQEECSLGADSFKRVKTIYVPSSGLTWYITATNWSTISSKLVGYLDYDGTNIPTFDGYTPSWYADENCTIPVSTGDFVSGTRYFVKLTAI